MNGAKGLIDLQSGYTWIIILLPDLVWRNLLNSIEPQLKW